MHVWYCLTPVNEQSAESRVENMQALQWALDVENVLTKEELEKCKIQFGNCLESVPWKAIRGDPQPHQKHSSYTCISSLYPRRILIEKFEDKSRIVTFIGYEMIQKN
ncbi:hypothetical protein C1645_822039 [Glomus cerebriforme]|uniref:Uncharacterized protein n=1 Tax=Glomus cerebriforme TaxID=658196 RepID=A0A397SZE2_9GLOM|nr:hypothetical protein C1645_822039 [Glomus cerebriforme]